MSAGEPDAKELALELLREHGVPEPALFLYDRTGKRVKSFIGETESPAIESAINGAL